MSNNINVLLGELNRRQLADLTEEDLTRQLVEASAVYYNTLNLPPLTSSGEEFTCVSSYLTHDGDTQIVDSYKTGSSDNTLRRLREIGKLGVRSLFVGMWPDKGTAALYAIDANFDPAVQEASLPLASILDGARIPGSPHSKIGRASSSEDLFCDNPWQTHDVGVRATDQTVVDIAPSEQKAIFGGPPSIREVQISGEVALDFGQVTYVSAIDGKIKKTVFDESLILRVDDPCPELTFRRQIEHYVRAVKIHPSGRITTEQFPITDITLDSVPLRWAYGLVEPQLEKTDITSAFIAANKKLISGRFPRAGMAAIVIEASEAIKNTSRSTQIAPLATGYREVSRAIAEMTTTRGMQDRIFSLNDLDPIDPDER